MKQRVAFGKQSRRGLPVDNTYLPDPEALTLEEWKRQRAKEEREYG